MEDDKRLRLVPPPETTWAQADEPNESRVAEKSPSDLREGLLAAIR